MSGVLSAAELPVSGVEIAIKSVLILLTACAVTYGLKRFSAATRHFIWVVALSALIILPFLTNVLPPLSAEFLPSLDFVAQPTEASTVLSQESLNSAEAVALSSDVSTEAAKTKADVKVDDASPRRAEKKVRQHHWAFWVAVIWIAGAAMGFLFALVDILAITLVRRTSSKVIGLKVLPELLQQLAISNKIDLLTGPRIKIPATWGFIRHTILLPRNFQQWDAERQRVVLCHELAHVKRMDWLTQLVAWIVCSLFWFNPLAWYALRRMRIERERACDDLVLQHGAKASDYASHLLEIARTFNSWRSVSVATLAMARPTQLEGRLLAILDGDRNRSHLNRLHAVLLIALVSMLVLPIAACKTKRLPIREIGAQNIPSGLVSWWTGNGSAADLMGGNPGTLVGNAEYTGGKIDRGFLLYGTGDMVDVGNHDSLHLQNLSIQAWVKRNDPNRVSVGDWGNGVIFGYGLGGYVLHYQRDGIVVLNKVGDFRASFSPFKITDTKWHHIAVTKTNKTVFFYLDGQEFSGNPFDPGFEFTTDAAIGGRADNRGNAFIGVIDEVAVFDRALSKSEIRSLYRRSSIREADVAALKNRQTASRATTTAIP